MKFSIDSEVFKKAVERASVVCDKKAVLDSLRWIVIGAKQNNDIAISANNTESCVEITVYGGLTWEPGIVAVALDDVKKLFNLKGDILVEVSGGKLQAKSDKKKSAILTKDYDCVPVFVDVYSNECVCEAPKADFIETLGNIFKCASKDIVNPMMQGIHFTAKRIEALDSHRIGIRNVEWNKEGLNIVISGRAYPELKKVSANKQDDIIRMYTDNRCAKFVGEDFVYVCKLIDGVFFDVSKMLNGWDTRFTVDVDAKELSVIAKEYAKNKKDSEKSAMLFNVVDDVLNTVIFSNDYETSDKIEAEISCGVPDDFCYGVDPTFVSDACEIFDGDIKMNFQNGRYSPMMITKDDYQFVILPVNIGEDVRMKAREFVEVA